MDCGPPSLLLLADPMPVVAATQCGPLLIWSAAAPLADRMPGQGWRSPAAGVLEAVVIGSDRVRGIEPAAAQGSVTGADAAPSEQLDAVTADSPPEAAAPELPAEAPAQAPARALHGPFSVQGIDRLSPSQLNGTVLRGLRPMRDDAVRGWEVLLDATATLPRCLTTYSNLQEIYLSFTRRGAKSPGNGPDLR